MARVDHGPCASATGPAPAPRLLGAMAEKSGHLVGVDRVGRPWGSGTRVGWKP